jgi:hypothetical protein
MVGDSQLSPFNEGKDKFNHSLGCSNFCVGQFRFQRRKVPVATWDGSGFGSEKFRFQLEATQVSARGRFVSKRQFFSADEHRFRWESRHCHLFDIPIKNRRKERIIKKITYLCV